MLKPWTWQVASRIREDREYGQALAQAAKEFRPVVLRGLAADWPLLSAGKDSAAQAFAYLERFDRGARSKTMTGAPHLNGRFFYADDMRGYNFSVEALTLPDVFARLLLLADNPDAPAFYAGSNPADEFLPGFERANPLPLAIPPATARVWLGNASHVAPHFDVSENIAVVALGRRRFTLFPPEQTCNLYVGPLDVTIAGQPVSMVDIRNPDLDRFPHYAEAMKAALVADLEPGDAIYIPTLWWHCVEALDPINILVNYWYNAPHNSSPFAAMIHAMLAVRDLPEPERNAWRSWYDHFVFSGAATSAADHLPPHARGISGPPGLRRAEAIRNYVLRALGL